jgi:beta-lactamase class A
MLIMRTPRWKSTIAALFWALLLGSVTVYGYYLVWTYLSSNANPAVQYAEYYPEYETRTVKHAVTPGKQQELPLNGLELVTIELPSYAKVENGKLITNPNKYSKNYTLLLKDPANPAGGRTELQITVDLPKLNVMTLKAELAAAMGSNASNMGIYIEDLVRGEVITHQPTTRFKPGSISKLPVAFIVLKDLDSGKLKLTDTFPIYNKYKHSRVDAIGRLPQGTKVTVKQYFDELLKLSNNTAQYHLREMIGNRTQAAGVWSSGVLNERVQKELGAAEWGEDPHIATPRDVGKVWGDLYRGKLVSEQWKNYFLDTLGAAGPSLREGLPAGVPKGIRVVNKVGFLYGGRDNTYSDTGIVFGKYTDYIVVIFNNKATAFPTGSRKIKELSGIIYKHLDRN